MEQFCWLRSSLLVRRGRSTGGDNVESPNPRLHHRSGVGSPPGRQRNGQACNAPVSRGGQIRPPERQGRSPVIAHPGPPEIRPLSVANRYPFQPSAAASPEYRNRNGTRTAGCRSRSGVKRPSQGSPVPIRDGLRSLVPADPPQMRSLSHEGTLQRVSGPCSRGAQSFDGREVIVRPWR